jgi:DNA replication factor GINS
LYADLYNAWKSEISTRDPQALPSDFYRKSENYLDGLEREIGATDENSVTGRLALKEKKMCDRLFRELKDIRLRKLLEIAQKGETIDETNLTEEEKEFVKAFGKSMQNLSHAKVEAKPAPLEEKVELSVVRFLQDIPEIVGTDMRIYGPYKKEDVGSIPNHNAQALVRQGAAKEIEVRHFANAAKIPDPARHQQ